MIDAHHAIKLWDDAKAAFAGMEIIRTQLEAVFEEMQRLDPFSKAYKASDRKFNELEKEWDQAHREFRAGQAAFTGHIRAMHNSNGSSRVLRTLKTHLQRIEERIEPA